LYPPKHSGLDGVRVALLEARMAGELAALVRRYGGIVRSAPAVREAPLDCADAVSEFLNRIAAPFPCVYVFLTGAGVIALFDETQKQGRLRALMASLRSGTIVCRGPKPSAALKRYGINPNIVAASPYTSDELLESMSVIDLRDADVSVVHYGERNETLTSALAQRGATLHELCVYEWRLPDDIGPLQDVVRGLVRRELDAVVFTSQVQWKHLRQVASTLGLAEELVDALSRHLVVAAIGPICSGALIDAGVRPHVVPENPKMSPLVAALAQHFSRPQMVSPGHPSIPADPRAGT
jgi:uroporphyrinogen-III synthase